MFHTRPERRVVVTGCGLVTPAGNTLEAFWDALYTGQTAIAPLRNFAIAELPDLVGGEVDLANASQEEVRGRCGELAVAAAQRAAHDADLSAHRLPAACGVLIGTTLGEERQVGALNEQKAAGGGLPGLADFFSRADNHRLAAAIARELGAEGPVLVNTTACSSGNAALAWAYELIASGTVDMMIAGGADTLTRLTYCGFRRMGALSKTLARPFHKDRDGVSFGEGAGILVLEDLDHARARGARIRAELAGYGLSNDAYHLTAPEPSGDGFARAIRQALATTHTSLEDVDYVSAHGTGTQYNDAGEVFALKSVFGGRAKDIPVSSIKSMLGHTNGAASAIEAIACVLMMERQALLPTARLTEPDPNFGLDFVPLRGRPARVSTCLNLAAGFGGFNVCVVLKGAP